MIDILRDWVARSRILVYNEFTLPGTLIVFSGSQYHSTIERIQRFLCPQPPGKVARDTREALYALKGLP
jgi:hypothetical protein